ncbi:MAG TPA: extracellular solute-binding protein [Actinomycetota bacterium]|nr:extracellular solute-binding protein [Actinomycetota bacterium]
MTERIGRRAFLRRGALLAAAVPLLGAAVACDRRGPMATGTVPEGEAFGPLPVDHGLTLASDLPIERGATLRVYEWQDYLSSRVLASFEQAYAEHDVHVEVESFTRIDEAIARLQQPSADFDVVFPVVDVLQAMVAAGLLRPLNHEYLPHLPNLWGWFRDGNGPFYDPGQRYTTPYTIYTGGIGWRADMVRAADAPDVGADPYRIFTDTRYRNLVGIYDAYRDAIALGLQQAGVADLTAATTDQLTAAGNFLADAVATTGARFTDDGAEEGLPEKEFAVHQAWSGDILTAPRYAAADGDDPNEIAAALRYWSPSEPARVVGLDLTAICANGRNPVAAHAFLDHLLRFDVALDNFAWNGYQVPMEGATREAFADPSFRWHKAVPPNLRDAIVSETEFAQGQMLVGFARSQDAAWLAQWSRVVPA